MQKRLALVALLTIVGCSNSSPTEVSAPTPVPSIAPTITPTLIFTLVPTLTPTVPPTFSPTFTPTITPTKTPTLTPTPSYLCNGPCPATYDGDLNHGWYTESCPPYYTACYAVYRDNRVCPGNCEEYYGQNTREGTIWVGWYYNFTTHRWEADLGWVPTPTCPPSCGPPPSCTNPYVCSCMDGTTSNACGCPGACSWHGGIRP